MVSEQGISLRKVLMKGKGVIKQRRLELGGDRWKMWAEQEDESAWK